MAGEFVPAVLFYVLELEFTAEDLLDQADRDFIGIGGLDIAAAI